MANSENEKTGQLFRDALTTVRSPIGIVIVIIAVGSQAFDAVITIISREGASLIPRIFYVMLGFMFMIFLLAIVDGQLTERRQAQREIEELKDVIRQQFRQLREQLEERRNSNNR